MTVAMALAENLHHSHQKAEGCEHEGPRAPKTARATGARPGVLQKPEPQEGAVTDGYVAAPVPSLAVPLLAGAAGDAVDARTLSFLLAKSVAARKKDEEEKEMEQLRAKHKAKKVDKLGVGDGEGVGGEQGGVGGAAAASGRARRAAR